MFSDFFKISYGSILRASLFVPAVDVGSDVLDNLRLFRVAFDGLLDLTDGVDDCTVIPAAELLADLVQREVGHPSDLIHSDLAGQHDVLGPALAP